MKKPVLTAAVAMLTLAACNKTETTGVETNEATAGNDLINEANGLSTAEVDTAFVGEAMQGDNAEVAIGRLAVAQGASQSVKNFGKMLVDDHGAHKEKLKALALTAGLPVTDDPSAEGKSNLEKLQALRGDAFDKQFKTMMVEDHTKDIAKYEKQAESNDSETAALAKETLPTLRKHLEAANAL